MNDRLPQDYDDLREAFYAAEKERDELKAEVERGHDDLRHMRNDMHGFRRSAERYKAQLGRVREWYDEMSDCLEDDPAMMQLAAILAEQEASDERENTTE